MAKYSIKCDVLDSTENYPALKSLAAHMYREIEHICNGSRLIDFPFYPNLFKSTSLGDEMNFCIFEMNTQKFGIQMQPYQTSFHGGRRHAT